MSTIEEKNGHVLANAEARVENENQNHCYCENETAGHITGEFEHKGEDVDRTEKASTATAGRHITSGKNGLQVAAERKPATKPRGPSIRKLGTQTRNRSCLNVRVESSTTKQSEVV
jgi:hypothetical protein